MNTRHIFNGNNSAAALFAFTTIFIAVLFTVSCTAKATDELVIYSYDSFTSEWGPGPAVIAEFEELSGIKVTILGIGDAGQTMARVIEEKAAPKADLIIGIDNHLLPKALQAGILAPYKPANSALVPEQLILDQDWHLTPFDYSTFAIIWDSELLTNPPQSLEDLTKTEYKDKLILMDPRTSTPGLGFAAWTSHVYGTATADYWKRLAPSILAMTSGWSTGYGLFTSGEAPLVISYTTSAAYHAEYESAGRYRALEFAEGHPIQIEGIGMVHGAKNRVNAERFLDFVLSEGFQKHIPLTNWMYPINPAVELPASFSHSPVPANSFLVDATKLDGLDRLVLDAVQSGQ
ncbi:MAG: thiamine ABC transporter substrate-binding protein [Spirochaetes bacterium]|nr:thiamine ABC transporter substrate-binding protein [Spirochaetota bacterium]MBU0956285.1 thiamine ABC transporter substrate-binding protein [Spirochaetota bacterium]